MHVYALSFSLSLSAVSLLHSTPHALRALLSQARVPLRTSPAIARLRLHPTSLIEIASPSHTSVVSVSVKVMLLPSSKVNCVAISADPTTEFG